MSLIWKFVSIGIKGVLLMMVLSFCFLCSTLTLGFVNSREAVNRDIVTGKDFEYDDIAHMLYGENKKYATLTQGYHGLDGYKGYDYSVYCGAPLYSPLPSTGVVKYNGLDGYVGEYSKNGEQNTMITIVGEAGEVTLFHGVYDKVRVGDTVVGGITRIGEEATKGNSTGCHSHIVWKPNESYFAQNQNMQVSNDVVLTGKRGNYGSVLTDYRNVKLRVSHYIPSQGGVNCDSDCTTMASGDKVASWLLGRNGVKASACPQEWSFGTRFMLSNQVYECRDTGGYINCYDIGDYDPALKNYAKERYCWVDLLSDGAGYAYGDFALDWNFVK